MTDLQTEGISRDIQHLLPSVSTSLETVNESVMKTRLCYPKHSYNCGESINAKEMMFWFRLRDGRLSVITARRDHVPFTKAERKFMSYFSRSIEHLMVSSEKKYARLAEQIASRNSFKQLLIFRYLRGSKKISAFWTPALIVSQLQELAFQRYEGKPCTSGVVVVNNPSEFVKQLSQDAFAIDLFDSPIRFGEAFYSKPVSYRHVEGRNAFYMIDIHRNVIGILRCREPDRYNLVARVGNKHLDALFQQASSRVWISYVGNNDDVNVVLINMKQLRWLKGHWHFIDRRLLGGLLIEHGFMEYQVEALGETLFTIADLRRGALILIPDRDETRPPTVGLIDDSPIRESLSTSIIGRAFSELTKMSAAIGMLTSDGLTTISKSGNVLGSGEIISLHGEQSPKLIGGGRTQAAITASDFGLAIKISEDGPISVFKKRQEIIRFIF